MINFKVTNAPPINFSAGARQGPAGGGGGGSTNTFETVSQSLGAYPATINYESDRISSIVYTLPNASTITKTINYTNERVTSIVLSGATPAGISLTKTFAYTDDNITGVSYS